MGIQTPHGIGRNELVYAVAQTAIGTGVWPAGTDAIRVLKTTMERKRNRKPRADKRASRDVIGRFSSRVEGTWSIEKYLMGSGAAGTAPDDRDFLINGIGPETISASTSATYAPTVTQAPNVLSIIRNLDDVVTEWATGCLVDEVKFTFSGEDDTKVTYSGPLRDIARIGGPIVTTAQVNTGATTLTMSAAHSRLMPVGSRFQMPNNSGTRRTNSGAGYAVTVNPANGTVTFDPAFTEDASISSGGAIYPFVPSPTVAGSPVDGTVGSITIAGTTVHIQSAEVTVKNNLMLENDRYGSAYLEDAVKGQRDISGSITLRLRRDQVALLADTELYTATAIVIASGTTAGSIATMTMTYCELDTSALEIPEAEIATHTIPFVALGSGSGENSISLVFT